MESSTGTRRRKHENGTDGPTTPIDRMTTRRSANRSGLNSTSPERVSGRVWASPQRALHFITLINERKRVLFPRKETENGYNKAAFLEGLRKARIAWKKIAGELKLIQGRPISWRQCKARYEYMKKVFMETHLPRPKADTGKRIRVSPWPYSDQFRPIMVYILNLNPVTGDEAKLKKILGPEVKPEESQALDHNENNDEENEKQHVEGVEASIEEDSDVPSSASDPSKEDLDITTSHSKAPRFTNETTKILLKLVQDHREILFSRKPGEPEKYAYGYSRRRRSWRRIAIEVNKAEGMKGMRTRHCRLRFEYLRRIFTDLTRPIKERIEKKSSRKTAWPFYYTFREIMKYICEQHPASADDRMKRLLEEDDEGMPEGDSLDWHNQPESDFQQSYEDNEVRERVDWIHTESEMEDKGDEDFDIEEEDLEDDDDDDSEYVGIPFRKASTPVRRAVPIGHQPRADQAPGPKAPFSPVKSSRHSLGLPAAPQATSVEKVRTWATSSSESSAKPRTTALAQKRATATPKAAAAAGGSSSRARASEPHRSIIIGSTSSLSESGSSATIQKSRRRKRSAGHDKDKDTSAGPKSKKEKLMPAARAGRSPDSQNGEPNPSPTSNPNQTTNKNDLLLEEMRGMRADIRALTESLTQFVTTQSQLSDSLQSLLNQNRGTGNARTREQ